MASTVVAWPTVALGEVLALDIDAVPVDASAVYPIAGVYSFGRGLFARSPLSGAETTYKVFHRLHADHFVMSQLKAWEGALALVSDTFEGWYLSPQFPTFRTHADRLDIAYLDWYCRQASVWEQLRNTARGMGARRDSVSPAQFLRLQVPLPPLEEQRRIVARIEALAERIAEARGLRRAAMAEAEGLLDAALRIAFAPPVTNHMSQHSARETLYTQAKRHASQERSTFNGAHPWEPNVYENGIYDLPSDWVWTDLGSVLTHLIDCVNDTPNFADTDSGLYGLKSTNVRPYKLDLSRSWFVSEQDFNRWNRRETPQPGDLVLTREAPMGYVCQLPDGVKACLTQRLMLLRTDTEFVQAKYVLHFLNSSWFQTQVLESCRGLTIPHIRVQDAPTFKIPLAPISEQQRIVDYLDACRSSMDSLKRQQAESATELDALLPSALDRAFRGEL